MAARKKSIREKISETFTGQSKLAPKVNYGDIAVFGMKNVGKTSVINRFVNNYFTEKYHPTTAAAKYDVEALIECEKGTSEKKKMVFKKSFKKSLFGKSRPLHPTTTLKRVLTVTRSGEGAQSTAFEAGKSKGLKTLNFSLVDTPPDIKMAEPISYQATLANAKGFLLVCSFDVLQSLNYVNDICMDIINARGRQTPIIIIANKSDLAKRLWDESESNTIAAQLKVKYCLSSVATKEGCERMTEIMLNEINVFAEEESYQNSLPEDYAYYVDDDEIY